MALLTMHEFQHVKLDAIRDNPAIRLTAVSLLQGSYAHLAVTDCWRQRPAKAKAAGTHRGLISIKIIEGRITEPFSDHLPVDLTHLDAGDATTGSARWRSCSGGSRRPRPATRRPGKPTSARHPARPRSSASPPLVVVTPPQEAMAGLPEEHAEHHGPAS